MVSRSFSYPIPVVGWGNDVEGKVADYSLHHVIHDDVLVLTIKGLQVSNAAISALLGAGVLGWAIRLHCKTTYFRRTWLTAGPEVTLKLPLSELAQSVEISVEVVAKQSLDQYCPSGLHPDFGDAKFKISAGDVVAIGPDTEIFVDLGFDPLKGEVSSIMVVQPAQVETGAFAVNFDAERIVISIPSLDWTNYKKVKNLNPAAVHASIVLPVLVEAVSLVRDEQRGSAYAGLLWYGRVRAWLDARSLDPGEPLVAAQKLLDLPMTRMLNEAVKAMAQEETT